MLGNTEETGKIDHIQVEESQQVASLPEQIVSIDQSIFDAKGNVKSVRRHRAVYFAMSALLAILVALHYGHVLTMPLVVQIGVWVLLILFFFIGGLGTDPEKAQAQVDKLENNKRIYLSFLNISTDEAYFDRLVKINVENLSEYYSLVKVHTGQSFNLSLIVSVVGFVMISAGLVPWLRQRGFTEYILPFRRLGCSGRVYCWRNVLLI